MLNEIFHYQWYGKSVINDAWAIKSSFDYYTKMTLPTLYKGLLHQDRTIYWPTSNQYNGMGKLSMFHGLTTVPRVFPTTWQLSNPKNTLHICCFWSKSACEHVYSIDWNLWISHEHGHLGLFAVGVFFGLTWLIHVNNVTDKCGGNVVGEINQTLPGGVTVAPVRLR